MDTTSIDQALATLNENKRRWARLPIETKIYLLDTLRRRVGDVSSEWVEEATAAKGIAPGSHLAGEEWTSGPYALAAAARAIAETLLRLKNGTPILEGFPTRSLSNGQTAVRVFPANVEDRFFLSGHTAEVWMRPGVSAEDIEGSAAPFYRMREPEGSVALVLGAGNSAAIAPLDALTELFTRGSVTAVKLSPVSAYLGPYFEHIFEAFVEGGFVRFLYGGVQEGEYLTRHVDIDHVHVTGAATTHDAIVYGTGRDAGDRKTNDEPVISASITSELGGVGPTIVVGGEWSEADLRYQAQHILSQKLHNHGFNCVACQVLVVPENWDQADDLLQAMRSIAAEVSSRDAYYPGAADRHATVIESHPDAEILSDGTGPITFISDLDPMASDDTCFTTEFFGAILGIVRLPGSDVPAFLQNAVEFANGTLEGNLGANLIIHPADAKRNATALESAVHDLRYGTVAVNSWVGVAFALNSATWGAFPGNPRNNIESGSGVVHNALMLEGTEKTVVYGSFAPFPRTVRLGVIHMEPVPPFFITNRQASRLGKLLTEHVVTGSWMTLPAIATTAMKR